MDPNIGTVECAIRIVFGLILMGYSLVALYVTSINSVWMGTIVSGLIVLGAYLLITGGIRRCPVNAQIGRDSRQEPRQTRGD